MFVHRMLHHVVENGRQRRRGAFMILAVSCLVLTIGFVSLSVDMGMVSMTRSRMQSAVDAAALAAAMEITHAVESAPTDVENIFTYVRTAAANKAAEVAQLNGFYVDPAVDVEFGSRTFNESTGQFGIDWSVGSNAPTNVVKVTARKENADLSQPDARLRLFFAGMFGDNTASLRTEAIAYVEARDIVVVHDFSRSMNFDSYFYSTPGTLSDAEVLANLQLVYDDLQPLNLGSMVFTPQWLTVSQNNPNLSVTFQYASVVVSTAETLKSVVLRFTNNSTQTFTASGKTGTFAGTGSNNGRNINRATVTLSVASQVPQAASVSQSGSPTVHANFAGSRESVTLSASSSWNRVELEFTNGAVQSWSETKSSETYAGTGANSGRKISRVRVRYGTTWRNWITAPNVTYTTVYNDETYVVEDTNNNVKAYFGLNSVSYPYPSGSWDDYIDYVRGDSNLLARNLAEKYGGMTFVQYVLAKQSSHASTPALALTRHYPFHAIKKGHLLLCDFLASLGFNDYLGMVSYDTYSRVETSQSGPGIPTVNITDQPLTTNYQAIADLMKYKQADHYYPSTNIGGGMRDAVALLDAHRRPGARPNIILMTDGNANITNGSTTLPSNYQSWFSGYDGAGSSYSYNYDNPSTSVRNARMSLLHEVNKAVAKGYVVHTIAVGADADWRTMKAVAHYSKGEFIYVPATASSAEMEAALMQAFHRIAGLVPPAKLMGQ